LVVEDDGKGVPETLRNEIIERGRRLDETVPGSGLGLDIVRDIAEMYRGSLELKQSSSGGIRASLVLPSV
ncbi:MAG: sensor histidine kinase, partial [Gammaproteobacteria bacterium]|nr:sensor histidine kinase [Gammaproteobacteria bacterium]